MLLWYNTRLSNPSKSSKHCTRDAAVGRGDLIQREWRSCPMSLVQGSKVHKWKYSQVYIGTLLKFVLLSPGMFYFG